MPLAQKVKLWRHIVQYALGVAAVAITINAYHERWRDVAIMSTGWVICFVAYFYARRCERSLTG